jgi:hypothetical protein
MAASWCKKKNVSSWNGSNVREIIQLAHGGNADVVSDTTIKWIQRNLADGNSNAPADERGEDDSVSEEDGTVMNTSDLAPSTGQQQTSLVQQFFNV